MSMTPQQLQALLRAGQGGASWAGNLAPTSGIGAASPYLGNAASGVGIASGIAQGGVSGYGSAAANAGKLAGNLMGNKALSSYGADAGNVLGIYNGIKQGGVAGYGGAAVNGAQLGANLGAFGSASGMVGSAAGAAAVPLSIYNEVKNWQSGATGQDALGGAGSGAAIGTMIMPGIGTAVGALIGGAAGALSSAFGNGRVDPENASFNGYTDAYNKAAKQNPALGNQVAASVSNPYLALAGMFDLRKNQIKGDIPIYDKYGRMGEKQFADDMDSHIQSALDSGSIKMGDDANTIYNKAVSPWLSQMGNWDDSNKDAMTALIKQMGQQYVTGQYKQNWQSMGGQSPFAAPQAPVAAPKKATNSNTFQYARGGTVNDYERAARLHQIYSGGLRKTNYDDGGGVTSYFGGPTYDNFSDPTLENITPFDPGSVNYDPFDLSSGAGGSGGSASGSSGSNSGAAGGSALANLLKGLGVSGSTAQSAAPYAALAPILGQLLGVNNQGKAPGLPSQYGPALNIPTPTNTRQQNNLSGMSMNDWLHAGEGPEIQYYQNNALPATQMSSPDQQVSQAISAATGQPFAGGYQYAPTPGGANKTVGGLAPPPAAAPQSTGTPNMNIQPLVGINGPAHLAAGGAYDDPSAAYGTSAVGHVKGPGDGTSDSIHLKNASLSNGEYVMDAPTVSILGAGSNDAGAKALDAFRADARKHAGKHLVKGKQPMKAYNPSAYFFGGGQ